MLVMRLFELTALPEKLEEFSAVGVHNLMSSLEKEVGTFFMASTYEAGQPSKKVVFEIYQDDEAYQVHVVSEHFGQFAAFTKDSFSERLVHTLVPEVTVEKVEQKAFSDASGLHLRLARVRVAQENAAAFKAIVAEEMATSVEVEAGVLALLAGRDSEDLSQWYFFEVYADESAYEKHCQSPHFEKYIKQSADLVLEKTLQVLTGETWFLQRSSFNSPPTLFSPQR